MMETDYLVVGGGAVGMAFVDTLLDESDAHITLVDRRSKPGGHWNDAYSFVTLHQPSAFYGVNSTALGSGRIDDSGPNAGLHELATGAEINAYYERLLHQRFLPSGRVRWMPMSEWREGGGVANLLSGEETTVTPRRKTVDATLFSPGIPATHTRHFEVADGVRIIAPNALPLLWLGRDAASASPGPMRFCLLGAGKTAMDAGVWLLRHGVPADAIHWVVPRDSWLLNRLHTQPGIEFVEHSLGGEADKLGAFASAASVEDVFLRLEASGYMLRIDRDRMPGMFHYATISLGEVELLREIRNVIRQGRVQRIERDALVMDQGRVAMAPDTLYIDCTASAVQGSERPNVPVFQGDRICLQLLRAPLVTLSAAVTAWVEVHGGDDARKNQLCTPVPFPRNVGGYAMANLVNMKNQFAWSQDKALQAWLREARLDGFAKVVSEIPRDDAAKMALLGRLRTNAMAAMENLPKLAGLTRG